jgi:hypothetical protein
VGARCCVSGGRGPGEKNETEAEFRLRERDVHLRGAPRAHGSGHRDCDLQERGWIRRQWCASQQRGTKQVKPNALGPQDLGASSVTSSEVANNAITTGDVAPDAIMNQNLAPGSVTGTNLAPNSVTPSAVQDSSYTPLTLENGWSSPDGYYQAAYTVEPDGLVRLRGAIAGGTDFEFARLPAGIRPTKILQTAIYADCPPNITDGLYIEGPLSANTGQMSVSHTGCGIYSLDGVTYQP